MPRNLAYRQFPSVVPLRPPHAPTTSRIIRTDAPEYVRREHAFDERLSSSIAVFHGVEYILFASSFLVGWDSVVTGE